MLQHGCATGCALSHKPPAVERPCVTPARVGVSVQYAGTSRTFLAQSLRLTDDSAAGSGDPVICRLRAWFALLPMKSLRCRGPYTAGFVGPECLVGVQADDGCACPVCLAGCVWSLSRDGLGGTVPSHCPCWLTRGP